MKKRKLLLAVLSFASATACVLGTAACKNEVEPEHEHSWGDWTTVTAATCEAAGKEERVCKDDPSHRETRDISALGHSWGNWKTKTEANCVDPATEERVCANDSTHIEVRDKGEALGHSWGDWTVATKASADEVGEEKKECTVCHTSETRGMDDPDHVHTYSEAWTESAEGHYHLSECGHDVTTTPVAHSYAEGEYVVGDETKTAAEGKYDVVNGQSVGLYHAKACETCGHVYYERHNSDNGTTVKERTCDTDGSTTHTCSCGYEWVTVIPAGHETASVWSSIDGEYHWKKLTCEHGEQSTEKQIEILQEMENANLTYKGKLYGKHNFDGGKVTKQPTTTEAGEFTYTCTDCGHTKTEEINAVVSFDIEYQLVDSSDKNVGGVQKLSDTLYLFNDVVIALKPVNVLPESASLDNETVKVYLVEGEELTELNSTSLNVMAFWYADGKDVRLRVLDGQTHKIRIATEYAHKEFTVIPDQIPENVSVSYLEYSEKEFDYVESSGASTLMYTGQTLNLTYSAINGTQEFTVTAGEGNDGLLTKDGGNVAFAPTAAGNYTLTFSSAASAHLNKAISVTVVEAPEKLTGTYKGGDYTLTFGEGTLDINNGTETKTLAYTYENGTLTAEGEGYTLALNPLYHIELTVSETKVVLVSTDKKSGTPLSGTKWNWNYSATVYYQFDFSEEKQEVTVKGIKVKDGVVAKTATATYTLEDVGDGKYKITFTTIAETNKSDGTVGPSNMTQFGKSDGSDGMKVNSTNFSVSNKGSYLTVGADSELSLVILVSSSGTESEQTFTQVTE